MVSEPVIAPVTDGVNRTLTVHEAPALNEDPQLWLPSEKFPVTATDWILTLAVLVFLNVITLGNPDVPRAWGLNATLNGEGVTIGLLATVKGNAANAAQLAPLGKLSTHTWKAPGFATCEAVTVTLNCVLLMNFTLGNVPFTETTELALNPVPLRVSVKLGLPATAAAGLRLVRVSGGATVL
jgi:hypothetical protein